MARPDPLYELLGWQPIVNPTGRVRFNLLGRRCYIDPMFVPLWTEIRNALEDTGYENPTDWIGIHKYRVVAGTNQLSRHSYTPGIAFDLDYGGDTDGDGDPTIDKNPHLHRPVVESDYGNTIQLLRHQVDAVLSIKTVDGYTVLRWLGDRNGDSMHFDTIVGPDALRAGILPYQGADMSYADLCADKVAGYAEDRVGTWNRFARLFDEPHLTVAADFPVASLPTPEAAGSDTIYWYGLLDNTSHPEWPGFFTRTELEAWATTIEGA